jgi:alkylhydroperoxidase family enzyme
VDSDDCHWLTKEILARRNSRNLHRMLGHSGPVADAFVRLATTLRYESELQSDLREIAILRVGVLFGSAYEVTAHRAHARQAGLSDAQIACVEAGDAGSGALSPLQVDVMKFTDDVVANVRASDATFLPLVEKLGHRPLVELVVAVGFYMAACRFLQTFDIDMHT